MVFGDKNQVGAVRWLRITRWWDGIAMMSKKMKMVAEHKKELGCSWKGYICWWFWIVGHCTLFFLFVNNFIVTTMEEWGYELY